MTEEVKGTLAKKASSLQLETSSFAKASTKERERKLGSLLETVDSNADAETIGILVGKEVSQERLKQAVELALETPWEVEGEPVIPWTGGFTVVTMNQEGKIVGGHSSPTKGLEDFGDLFKHALTKALGALHLEKAGMQGGIGKLANFKYLTQDLGLGMYTGATESSMPMDGQEVIIGVSGASVKKEYLKKLLAEAEPGVETQAGLFDEAFSGLVGMYLSTQEPVSKIDEPDKIQTLRINN